MLYIRVGYSAPTLDQTFCGLLPSSIALPPARNLDFKVGRPVSLSSAKEHCPDPGKLLRALPRLNFWTSDIHNGTRIDLPTVLSQLGQGVTVAGFKREANPYPEVLF